MNKTEYLKIAIKHGLHSKIEWLYSVLAIVKNTKVRNVYYDYELVAKDGLLSYYSPTTKSLEVLLTITGPLFTFKENITVDETWLPNISEKISTTIGNLLTNAVLISDNFGNKIPYFKGRFSIRDIEALIAPVLVGDGDDMGKESITIEEYENYVDSVSYFKNLSKIAVVTATEKNILPPPGLIQFKKDLKKKYEGKLNTYVGIAAYEKELLDFDKEYLKDDPSNGSFLSGKVRDISRKKMFLSYGANPGFTPEKAPHMMEKSLNEGWDERPESIVSMNNSLRFASYSRGSETQSGGLAAKVILRSTNNLSFAGGDCGTKKGLKIAINSENHESIVGFNLITNGKVLLVKDTADSKKYIGKTIEVRSTMYCKKKKQVLCKTCAGTKLSEHSAGAALSVTEVSGMILNASMKAVHGKVLSVVEFDPSEAFS